MKKISKLLIILILFMTIVSCDKEEEKEIIYYNQDTQTEYIEKVYELINDDEVKYVACDLRTKEVYETEHIRQFQNYDISVSSNEEFNTWITSNYSDSYHVIIFSESSLDDELINSLSDIYNHIYIYNGSYDNMKASLDEYFVLESGPYDCGC